MGKFKIVWTDGYNRDTISESLVCENIRSEAEGKRMLEGLLDSIVDQSDWYRLIGQDESLYTWEP